MAMAKPKGPFVPKPQETQLDRIERKVDGLAHAFASFLQVFAQEVKSEDMARTDRVFEFIETAKASGAKAADEARKKNPIR